MTIHTKRFDYSRPDAANRLAAATFGATVVLDEGSEEWVVSWNDDTAEVVQDLLPAYNEVNYAVWVLTPGGGFWQYRTNVGGLSVAQNWAKTWTDDTPADVPPGSVFHALKVTSTYELEV